MPLPHFMPTVPAPPRPQIRRNAAATQLEISRAGVNKLVDAGILPNHHLLPADAVAALADRHRLMVATGGLTVLRTAARAPAYDDRTWIGFHVDHTDTELDETSLRWWRSDPDKIIDNVLYTVVVATVPAAVYKITGVLGQTQRPGEQGMRYHYSGDLLARLTRSTTSDFEISYRTGDSELLALTKRIMESRIVAPSGGPIAYLGS